MLTEADAVLIRRDPGLPSLGTLLDPDGFAGVLRGLLPDSSIGCVHHTYLRYKPGTSCLAGFCVEVDGQSLQVHAVTLHRGDAEKLAKPTQRPCVGSPSVKGVFLLEEVGLVISFFPNDIDLRALWRTYDPEEFRNLLRKVAPRHRALWGGSMTQLTYKPQRRFVGRLSVDGQPRAVVRFYKRKDFAQCLERAKSFQCVEGFRIAPILGSCASRNVMMLAWSPGQPLHELAAQADLSVATELVRTTGAALAELHQSDLPNLSLPAPARRAASLQGTSEAVAWVCPGLADMAQNLSRQLAECFAAMPFTPAPLHGDFYAKQVLVDDGRLALIDFDGAFHGDPAEDLGNFVAHLDRWALWGRFPAERVEVLADALLEGYRGVARQDVAPRIAAYRASALLHLAPHCFRHREPDWASRTRAILGRTGQILQDAKPSGFKRAEPSRKTTQASATRSNTAVEVVDPFEVHRDAAMPTVAHALDPARVQEALLPLGWGRLVGRAATPRLRTIRVVRHKPGRRCMVEYGLEFPATTPAQAGAVQRLALIGKIRARGLKRSAYNVAVQQWRAGFDDQSADGVSVPQPIGVIPGLGMWLQRKVVATPATERLGWPGDVTLCGRIAWALYKIHTSRIPTKKRHTLADELAILSDRLSKVATATPAWRSRIDRILSACFALGAAIPQAETTGIHRDFYADQVLACADRLYVVDFDLYCQGDPALDMGNFIGHLTELALRQTGNPRGFAHLERVLEDAFVEQHGPHTRFAVRAYATLTLARHIHISTLFGSRKALTDRLVRLCEDRLEISQAGGRRACRVPTR